ncbi:shikimate kinase [Buchnera aphidicola str. Bp (Baizongia pistaciae)]|uniref:Shikimate kinase n=1 Tax=Buchnera aphidicola subsp. Baizongia pistaciae (strain Bp) TaxID=224915 RepID=AROK_BUCBP|nr:shikimate kinase AroK [Buchnera aphidicola]P59488.1 RecName: Full=Shikimate kinase; Short=SK [Buchnera aphidicola str. Bp (Baizongia pistaciae)]AAO27187.1 shikimate kinase [Buchnera aphidicola str. Bp (Baizongia pistaciae)]
MTEKRNIFLIGPMGAGKSTIGRHLAQQLSMEFYDSDQEIEKRTGVDVSWIFDIEGELGFRKREQKIISEIIDKRGIVLSTGGGSILSREIRNKLSSRGVVIYLETSVEKQLVRTKKNKQRPLLQVDNTSIQTVLEELAFHRNPLYQSIADITIRMNDRSIKAIVFYIIRLLNNF